MNKDGLNIESKSVPTEKEKQFLSTCIIFLENDDIDGMEPSIEEAINSGWFTKAEMIKLKTDLENTLSKDDSELAQSFTRVFESAISRAETPAERQYKHHLLSAKEHEPLPKIVHFSYTYCPGTWTSTRPVFPGSFELDRNTGILKFASDPTSIKVPLDLLEKLFLEIEHGEWHKADAKDHPSTYDAPMWDYEITFENDSKMTGKNIIEFKPWNWEWIVDLLHEAVSGQPN